MKKIPTLYKRNRETGRVYDEMIDEEFRRLESIAGGQVGEQIVAAQPTVKIDGTCCRYAEGLLWKRYDRKPTKASRRAAAQVGEPWIYREKDAKQAPDGWVRCQHAPYAFSGHWPGWLPVDGQDPADKWHMQALASGPFEDGTFELIGPKIQGNPYQLAVHALVRHGAELVNLPRTAGGLFGDLDAYLSTAGHEGIVWWFDGAPWVKIKASDFGHEWRAK